MRNQENAYREYSAEDIRTLKIIKLFRKLDMPIEEIRKLLHNDIALQEAIHMQKERLAKEKERLTDTMCLNPKEFTEALCKYGADNNLDLVITKEGMYPEFTIDGVEYTAARFFGRFEYYPKLKWLD